jgi:hypothetical protein
LEEAGGHAVEAGDGGADYEGFEVLFAFYVEGLAGEEHYQHY